METCQKKIHNFAEAAEDSVWLGCATAYRAALPTIAHYHAPNIFVHT